VALSVVVLGSLAACTTSPGQFGTTYTTVIEAFELLGPTDNRIYGQIRRPDPALYPNLSFPAVVLVPGGINPGRMEVHGQEAKALAEAGMVVVTFNAEGRVDTRAPEDLRSEGEEVFNGFRHQDGLAKIVEYVMGLAYVVAENVGLRSQSYGITMAAGCAGRHPELAIKYIVDGEGPPNSFVTCHGPRYLAGDLQKYNTVKQIFGREATWQDSSPENLDWWAEREAINFIVAFRGDYLRLQATWDHAQPPENQADIPTYHHPEGWPGGGPAWWPSTPRTSSAQPLPAAYRGCGSTCRRRETPSTPPTTRCTLQLICPANWPTNRGPCVRYWKWRVDSSDCCFLPTSDRVGV